MKKACLYTTTGDYQPMIDDLQCYIDNFEMETEVQPFMLSYRNYNLYIIEASGISLPVQKRLFERLPNIIRSNSTRVFGVWTQATWTLLQLASPQSLLLPNCVHCDQPNWIFDLTTALKSADRRIKDANESRSEEEE